jgi:hypothetical protein
MMTQYSANTARCPTAAGKMREPPRWRLERVRRRARGRVERWGDEAAPGDEIGDADPRNGSPVWKSAPSIGALMEERRLGMSSV